MSDKKHIHIPTSLEGRIAVLQSFGFVVGDRDQKMNSDFKGMFMVAECDTTDVAPQRDASCGDQVWCVVGDDLNSLVNAAFDIILRADDLYEFSFEDLKLYEVRENFRSDEIFIAAASGEQALEIFGGFSDDGACAREICILPAGILPGEVSDPDVVGPAVMKAMVADTFVEAFVVAPDKNTAMSMFHGWAVESGENENLTEGDIIIQVLAAPADPTTRLIDPDDMIWTMTGCEAETPSM